MYPEKVVTFEKLVVIVQTFGNKVFSPLGKIKTAVTPIGLNPDNVIDDNVFKSVCRRQSKFPWNS